MHLTKMLMQQYKVMINMETYNVFMHLVMIFQSMDVSMQMDSEPSMMGLVQMHVHLMEEHLVKSQLH